MTKTRKFENSSPENRENGSRTCNRSEVGKITISVDGSGDGFGEGVILSSPGCQLWRRWDLPLSKPRTGRDSPDGGWNLNSFPDGVTRESVIGLNSIEPANVMAVVNSGLVKKFIVPGFPSFRALHISKIEIAPTGSSC